MTEGVDCSRGPAPQQQGSPLPIKLLYILAICAGASVANLYYAQPLLAQITKTFDGSMPVGWVAVAPMIGYTLSLISVLPMGDLVDRRKLCIALAATMAIGAFGCAIAPSMFVLAVASAIVGFGAVVTQLILPMAADLVPGSQRARALGIVFSGVLAGILVARTVSGLVGQKYGWQTMFVLAGIAAIALAITLARCLPTLTPGTTQNYLSLFSSMWQMLKRHPSLRTACVIQACLFGLFTSFWSVLALLLSNSPFEMGPAAIGAFGMVGVVGVVAANVSGRLMERFGIARTRLIGIVCCLVAYLFFSFEISIFGLVTGVVLMDFGISIANVSSQSSILGLESAARNRINTLYVTSIFLGGSIGASLASIGWIHEGWRAVGVLGVIFSLVALTVHLAGERRSTIFR